MHTCASNSKLVEPLPELERTLNRRLRRRNRRVLFEQRNTPPQNPRVVYPPILDINYFRHFLVTLQNVNTMDDEPMWATDRVVAPTPSSAITIPETANEFAIKVIRVKQKQLNLGVKTERMIFYIDSAMKHSYSNDDAYFSIDVIDEILKEDFDALLDKGSEILHSIEGTILEEKLFAEFDEFIEMTFDENSESESDTEEPPFKKITFNTDYKIKTSLEEPSVDLELKPLPDNMEYVFLEEPSFLAVIISSQLFEENKNKLVSILKRHKQAFAWKTKDIPGICPSFSTFQRCMLAIFHDMIEESVEVFMDDFSVFRSSFDHCLNNLDKMLQRCKDAHLVLTGKNVTLWLKKKLCLDTRRLCTLIAQLSGTYSRYKMLNHALFVGSCSYKNLTSKLKTENVTAYHLSRIENEESSDDSEVDDNFPGEKLMEINTRNDLWFTDFANYLVSNIIPRGMTYHQKNKFFFDLKHYFWEEP
uniref:Reverse transcriptase domain-containing protein n=1 Tax=Tanacetum cinerariifolium TaxID=118510 RepID=A0A6L2M355_TANCI|nr:reverse transcriptase domain-containing protein [Tanacetum cinerariifolium]